MKIVIINYGAGNIQSIKFAIQRLGYEAVLTDDPKEIESADKVIFPGVGEASSAMHKLRASGLDSLIPQLKQPVLGICLGMQLLCSHSEENDTDCLGVIPQKVIRFKPNEQREKVPHMGWNKLVVNEETWLDKSLNDAYVYFVHSYYVEQGPFTIASANYINPFSAALRKDNFFATQFHPEKSGSIGEKILDCFLKQNN